ncbi:hypothetical protein BT69DRAFT_157521 [Atractiella rhizophila]|nr:hypothetical protein BT69DRAFT_157521 [Atractiella rhizophila]
MEGDLACIYPPPLSLNQTFSHRERPPPFTSPPLPTLPLPQGHSSPIYSLNFLTLSPPSPSSLASLNLPSAIGALPISFIEGKSDGVPPRLLFQTSSSHTLSSSA